MSIEFKMDGLEGIEIKLKMLNGDIKIKGARTALRAASNVIKAQSVENAIQYDDIKSPTKIWKNIVVKSSAKSFMKTGEIMFRVGVMGGAKEYAKSRSNQRKGKTGTYNTGGDKSNPGGDTWYWRFVEFGVPGRGIAGRSFLEKALREKTNAAITEFSRRFDKYIDRKIRAGVR